MAISTLYLKFVGTKQAGGDTLPHINIYNVSYMDEDLKTLLRQYADRYETAGFISGDPSWFMHQVQGRYNRETLAFVNVVYDMDLCMLHHPCELGMNPTWSWCMIFFI